MFRLLFIALAIWLAYKIITYLLKSNQPTAARKARIERNMVRCKHCGLHILENEAIRDGRDAYCSEKHRLAEKH